MYLGIFNALTWEEKITFKLRSFFGHFNRDKISKMVTKVCQNLPVDLNFTKSQSNQLGDFVNFFGLLRKPELWTHDFGTYVSMYLHFIKSSKLKLIEKTPIVLPLKNWRWG